MLLNRSLSATVALFTLLITAGFSEAQTSTAINRAQDYLDSTNNAKHIIGIVHMGADLTGFSYVRRGGVTNHSGESIPGHFYLAYDYEWNSGGYGETRLAFLCDERGTIYEVKNLGSSGVLQAPFLVANGTIKIIGQLLIEAFREEMTNEELKQVQRLVQNSDSKGLLEMGIGLRQAFGTR